MAAVATLVVLGDINGMASRHVAADALLSQQASAAQRA
jgi:hypothetical protein